MKIFSLPSLIFFVTIAILFFLILGEAFGQEFPEDDDSGEDSAEDETEDADSAETKKKVEPQKEQVVTAAAATQVQVPQDQYASAGPYLNDPYIFYKWPGVGQSEGVHQRWPWWPDWPSEISKLVEDEVTKKLAEKEALKKKKDAEQDDESEEDDEDDDEPQDDFFGGKRRRRRKHHHNHRPWDHKRHRPRKQYPTAAYSVGNGPAKGKETWYGVLHADVNSRADLGSDEVDEGFEETDDQDHSNPLVWYPPAVYYGDDEWQDQENLDQFGWK